MFPQIVEFTTVKFLGQYFYIHAITGKPMSKYVVYSIGSSTARVILIFMILSIKCVLVGKETFSHVPLIVPRNLMFYIFMTFFMPNV